MNITPHLAEKFENLKINVLINNSLVHFLLRN